MPFQKFAIAAVLSFSFAHTACDAPPSVQQVIDKAQAEEAANAPRLVDPVLSAAQAEGRELYRAFLIGNWAPADMCESANLRWSFSEEVMSRPADLSNSDKPCKLAVTEALQDGSIAVAAYCPRLDADDEAVVYAITRRDQNSIIVPGIGGGTLSRCP